ncbi:MAG TPA: 5-formyltetrahydrofolate cyclo-ligase [Labilithrix sp.]|jgi:5-formyltetrahydrofolate cyclo-ligase|nr:5-formyltetrahydrofolate cyclo-ligase [Labilithrix sp.]
MSSHRRGTDPGPPAPHSHSLAPEEAIRFKVKAELRKRLRGVRKTAPAPACAERSAKIVAALEAHDAVRTAKSVALFWPIIERHEVDLRPLDASLRARGARIAYPSIDPDSGDMVFRFVADPAHLEEAGYGFAEPPPDAPVATSGDLDVVIVPAIAVDPTGHRIGYGAGYYDRTLPKYAPPAVAIAVAYDYQLIAEVPSTPGDVQVAWVVTDQRVLDASSAR